MGLKETKKNGRVYLSDEKTGQRAGSRPLPVSGDPTGLILDASAPTVLVDKSDAPVDIGTVYEVFAQANTRTAADDAVAEAYLQAQQRYEDASKELTESFSKYQSGAVTKEEYTGVLAKANREKFAFQNAQRKYDETPEGQRALQQLQDSPDPAVQAKATKDLEAAQKRAERRAASQQYHDMGDEKTAAVVLAHGPEYAWASAAEFDLREAVFSPYAVTRSEVEVEEDDDEFRSREKIESFTKAIPLTTSPHPTEPDMQVTIYGVPGYSESDGDRLIVIAETSETVSNYRLGTLTKDGKLQPGKTDVLARFMEEERGPVSEHTGKVVEDWTYHVTKRNHEVAGLSLTAFTAWETADPDDFHDYDRNDDW